MLSVLTIVLTLSSLDSWALPPTESQVKGLGIANHSRPCCTFGNSPFTSGIGLGGVIGIDTVGPHHFFNPELKTKGALKLENNGILYSCRAGFIDLAHLRDNADWVARFMGVLPSWLGSGKTWTIGREAGKKVLHFPKRSAGEISKLNRSDIAAIAKRAIYHLAVWHEMNTALGAMADTPLIRQRISGFSVEDNYSNRLGAEIGALATLSDLPYEVAVTQLIHETLTNAHALSQKGTEEAFEAVKGSWWTPFVIPSYKNVKMRHAAPYQAQLMPALIPFEAKVKADLDCDGALPSIPLQNSPLLESGVDIDSLVQVLIVPAVTVRRKTGLNVMTTNDFPAVIQGIRSQFEKDFGKNRVIH